MPSGSRGRVGPAYHQRVGGRKEIRPWNPKSNRNEDAESHWDQRGGWTHGNLSTIPLSFCFFLCKKIIETCRSWNPAKMTTLNFTTQFFSKTSCERKYYLRKLHETDGNGTCSNSLSPKTLQMPLFQRFSKGPGPVGLWVNAVLRRSGVDVWQSILVTSLCARQVVLDISWGGKTQERSALDDVVLFSWTWRHSHTCHW